MDHPSRGGLVISIHRVRFFRLTAVFALMLMFSIGFVSITRGTPARAATGSTVVSLNFDDGTEDQYTTAFPMLQSLNMHGTFFIISGYANNLSGYMTLPQLQALYNAGNEIGGHTVLHPYLTQVSTDEATREICDSRDTLLNWGFPVTDFDYPHSASNATLESIAQQCGYNSARSDGEITSPDGCLSGCPMAETIPPADPYLIRSPDSIQDTWSVADIESLVTQAENNGGGWVNMIFHHICDNACDPYSITPANLQTVLTWLQTQPVSIEPINQVIGGSVNPPVSAPQVAPAPPGTNGVVNPSLETMDPYNSGTPYCWTQSTAGTNNATFAETSNAHTGQVAEQINISSFASGAARLIVKQDLGECAPSVVAGDAYVMSGWYQSSAPIRFDVWYRDSNGGWHWWMESPQINAASGWTQAVWATPAIPANAVGLSFGLELLSAGTLTVDDYSLVDTGGGPTSPTVSLTAPASGATLSGTTTLSANASSPVGISRVDFLVNGIVVGSSTTAPYTMSWDSTTVANGQSTFAARATDISGTQTTSSSVTATISNTTSSTLANGIEAYWKFDDGSGTSAADATGFGNTGTTHGSNIWTTAGKINGGLQLGGSGSGNYVSTSFAVPTSGTVTYAGWAQAADKSASYGILGGSAGSGNGMLVQIPSGTSNIKFWRHSSGVGVTFTGVVPAPGTWFQWVLVDNTTAQTTTLYINGVSAGTVSDTSTYTTPGTLEVGGYAGTSSPFKGLEDEVGVWNRALTSSEVSSLYNSGTGVQYPF
jgi:peptidoglycan/xylan/chitin deacetylase (PgdA/CDA1 family)